MVASGLERHARACCCAGRWGSRCCGGRGWWVAGVSEAAFHRCFGVSMGCQFAPVAVKHKNPLRFLQGLLSVSSVWSGRQDFILSQPALSFVERVEGSSSRRFPSFRGFPNRVASDHRNHRVCHPLVDKITQTSETENVHQRRGQSHSAQPNGNPLSGRRLTSSEISGISSSAACLVRLTSDLPGERSENPSPFPCP